MIGASGLGALASIQHAHHYDSILFVLIPETVTPDPPTRWASTQGAHALPSPKLMHRLTVVPTQAAILAGEPYRVALSLAGTLHAW